jgi:NAD(P)-dependent dehydrogenase (short-subunit alcohol dehydrogenase family)
MLGYAAEDELRAARRLTASFSGPLAVGAEASVVRRGERLALTGRGRLLASARISPDGGSGAAVASPTPPLRPLRGTPAADPLDATARGVAYPVREELTVLARRLGAEALPAALLHGLAWASYVAGMEAPGLHGLLTEVTLRLVPRTSDVDGAAFVVHDFDERTGRLVVASVLCGDGWQTSVEVEAFALTAPRAPDVDALRPVASPRTDDRAAVVVGASRGLGAATALGLALRGWGVHGVFASSTAAAEEVRELAGDDAGRLVLHRADAGDGAAMGELARALAQAGRPLDAIVLAAALPLVPAGLAGDGADALGDYVAASVRLAAAPLGALLPALAPDATVVFCSSLALSAPPRDWPHYVTAKGAVEGLAAWLAGGYPRLSTVVVRLPRMTTDMTNTPAGRLGAVAVEPIARWLAEEVVDGRLGPGLATLGCPPELATAEARR